MLSGRNVLPAGLFIAALMVVVPRAALAQPALPEAGVQTPDSAAGSLVGADLGAGWNILSIPSFAFHRPEDWTPNQHGYVFFALPFVFTERWAPVQLPTGAAIGQIGVFAYDIEPNRDVLAALRRFTGYGSIAGCSPCGPPDPPAVETIGFVDSSGTPGYQYSLASLNPPHVVDNYVHRGGGQYFVAVQVDPTMSNSLGFRGVEIWWKRQISPAPGVASFVDVPTTHLFFREIEALKEAGITLGCTATEFCPNASLTRAQMAAFLARALGLYWQF